MSTEAMPTCQFVIVGHYLLELIRGCGSLRCVLDRLAPAAAVIWQQGGVQGADGDDRLELLQLRGEVSACWGTKGRAGGQAAHGVLATYDIYLLTAHGHLGNDDGGGCLQGYDITPTTR